MSKPSAGKVGELSLEQAARRLASGELSAEALTAAVLERIEEVDPEVRAFLVVDREGALEAARRADRRRREGSASLLTGVPVAVKDNLCTRDLPTTCGSKLLRRFVPPYDATAVAALRREGAVILGKTNLDEFAMGGSTESSAFFPTGNPSAPGHVAGGSSGGSAAAVAYGGAPCALGSDTGGSIRQPASFCGVVGLKPSYGRVSRWGLVAMASSLDQVGPVTRTVRDGALLLSALAGHDPRDATSSRRPVPDYLDGIEDGVEGLTVGVVPELRDHEGIHPGVVERLDAARATYEELGARLVEVHLPHLRYSLAAYYLICPAEVSANLARYDGLRYGEAERGADLLESYRRTRGQGLGPEVVRRILLGAYSLSAGYYDAYYKKAAQIRTLVARDFATALESCDALLLPVTPAPAFRLGELVGDPLRLYLEDVFTVGLSLAGLPALSVPAGTVDGRPQGVQIAGRPFDEATVLRVARAFEKHTTHGSLAERPAGDTEGAG